jgi:hypothetical protein
MNPEPCDAEQNCFQKNDGTEGGVTAAKPMLVFLQTESSPENPVDLEVLDLVRKFDAWDKSRPTRNAQFWAFSNEPDELLNDGAVLLVISRKRERLVLGAILFEMKARLAKKGRAGQWMARLRELGLARSSADDLVAGFKTYLALPIALRQAAHLADIDLGKRSVQRALLPLDSEFEANPEPSPELIAKWLNVLADANDHLIGTSGEGEQAVIAQTTESEAESLTFQVSSNGPTDSMQPSYTVPLNVEPQPDVKNPQTRPLYYSPEEAQEFDELELALRTEYHTTGRSETVLATLRWTKQHKEAMADVAKTSASDFGSCKPMKGYQPTGLLPLSTVEGPTTNSAQNALNRSNSVIPIIEDEELL